MLKGEKFFITTSLFGICSTFVENNIYLLIKFEYFTTDNYEEIIHMGTKIKQMAQISKIRKASLSMTW